MKLSLKKQMILYFSIGFSFIFIAFGSLILSYNINSFQNQSYNYCRKIVKANISLIDNYFEELKNISKIVANDADIVKAVTYRNRTETINYSVELYNQRNVANKIKQLDVLGDITNAIIIGDHNRYLYYYGQSPVHDYDFSEQAWFVNASSTENYSVRFTNFHKTDYLLQSADNRTVSIITPIINASQYRISKPDFLLCDFNLDPIISDGTSGDDTQIAIYDGVNPVYFSKENQLSPQQMEQLTQELKENNNSFVLERSGYSKTSYIVVNEKSAISGWSILGIMPLTEIEVIRATNTTFVVALILISCIIIVLLSMAISKSILVPMNRLVEKFNEIAGGNINVTFETTRSVEINTLSSTAENMLKNIVQLTGDVVTEQKKLSQEQLKVLQHQINPHFLNNVLQSIKALAVCGDVDAISKITTLLGKILSYSVYNPFDKVKLGEEISYTENYIALQNIRYNHLISYSIDCDDNIKSVQVPKLIIQPLVENAIEHGFQNCNSGHISISAENDGDEIHLVVTNNGEGISSERLKELNEMLCSKNACNESKSIGLLNVNQRIKSTYGSRYGLKILSRAGMNTSIVIIMPNQEGTDKC